MNWWSAKLEEAGLRLEVHPAEDERLNSANQQIRNLIIAVAQRQAALKVARQEMDAAWREGWKGNVAHREVNGVSVAEWISDALDAGIRS